MKKLLFLLLLLPLCRGNLYGQCAVTSSPVNDCASYGDEIDAFTLNGVAATGISGCSPNGYASFITPVWSLTVGNTYTFSANVGSGTWQQGFAIWIDINNDGFYASSEMLFTASNPATSHTGSITIPYSATVANGVRMRLMCCYYTAINGSDACTNYLNYNGETQDFYVNIVCPSAPSVSVAATSTYVCSGTSVTLTATGAQSYTWTGGVSNGVGFVPSATTSYSVTGVINGCPSASATVVKTISVTSTPLAVSAAVSPTIVCAGLPATITASGASNYTFTPGSASGGTVNSQVVNPTTSTTYSVNGFNGTGCPGTATVLLAVNPVPTLAAIPSSSAICLGSTVSLNASGAQTYSWQPGGSGASIVQSPTTTAAYVLTGTNSFNCSASTTTVVIVNNPPPLSASASQGVICAGESITLTANGASSYSWTNGPTANTYVVNPSNSGSYSVTASSAQGCPTTAVVMVDVFIPQLTVSPSTAICEGDSYMLGASGADSYTWAGVGLSQSVTVMPTITSSYSLSTLTTSAGITCPAEAVVTVSVNAKPTVTASTTRATICRNEPIVLTAGGAKSYTWTTLNNVTGATVGITPTLVTTVIYSVTGEDANGCQNTAGVQVTVKLCNAIAEFERSSFAVYPNPGTGMFVVRTANAMSLQVMNAAGQVIKRVTVAAGESTIDLTELAVGVYYLNEAGSGGTRLVITK